MSLTNKQREALQALADVMQEHDIEFFLYHECSFYLILCNPYMQIQVGVAGDKDIDSSDITKLLQEQE